MALAVKTAVRRGRVLVVDDEPLVLSAVRRVLARDHDVEVASGGHAALALLENNPGAAFDLILCDLTMPGMSGLDLYVSLCQRMPAAAARVAFLTGGAPTGEARRFIAAAGRAQIDKPFVVDDLLAFVRSRVS